MEKIRKNSNKRISTRHNPFVTNKTGTTGITLIALVITIIVLLILAAVSIATLTGEDGILIKANEAKIATRNADAEEQVKIAILASYDENGNLDYEKLKENLNTISGITGIPDEITEESFPLKVQVNGYEVTVEDTGSLPTMLKAGKTATKTEKNNYEDKNHDKATIPEGFTVSETDNTINDGLVVIGPDKSEFVWIPVPNPVSTNPDDKPMAKEGIDGNGNYQGVLYSFSAPSGGIGASTSKENPDSNESISRLYGQGTTLHREPSLITRSSSVTKSLYESEDEIEGSECDKANASKAGYENTQKFGKAMQDDYNDMVESVKKYKGFYVGRYEMSLTGADTEKQGTGTAQSKKNVKSSTASDSNSNMWYGLYSKAKTYTETLKSKIGKEEKISVESGMIWGSQWDAMLNWMQENGVDVTSTSPNEAKCNETQITGNEDYSDKINNVYDLLGCNYEWTLEVVLTYARIYRGGVYDRSYSSSYSYGVGPTLAGGYYGSRFALYIK